MPLVVDRTKYMDDGEVRRLRAATEGWATADLRTGRRQGVVAWAVVDLALSTGLRVSELARLTVGDVDGKRRALQVCRSKRRRATVETLAIGRDLAEHLRDFIAWKGMAGEPTEPTAALLAGKRGPLGIRGLQQIWASAVQRAGLPTGLSIHCARHTLAVHLLRRSGNLRVVQKQLGHASPVTTANLYADVSFEDMQEAVTGLYNDGATEAGD